MIKHFKTVRKEYLKYYTNMIYQWEAISLQLFWQQVFFSDWGVYFEISKTGSTRKTIYFLHTFVQTSEEK